MYRQSCEEVLKRAGEALAIVLGGSRSLLTIALNHCSLGRAALGVARSAADGLAGVSSATEHLDRAVDGFQEAGAEEFIARGLLARAALRRFAGDPDGAAADLREALEIAERGSMRLHEADAHLEWTRLCLATHDPAAARRHLDRARELVEACGYGRRTREVTWLESRLAKIESPEAGTAGTS
jgi:hypothetical protein